MFVMGSSPNLVMKLPNIHVEVGGPEPIYWAEIPMHMDSKVYMDIEVAQIPR
jgi:hypothetical protein